MVFWRRRSRDFEVLGERFVLPSLDLESRLDRAARMRQRLGATWLDSLTDPLLDPFRKPHRRVRLRFLRAHRVLSAHEAIVYAAIDHVAIYDDALVRATQHVALRSRQKVDELLAKAAERQKIADRAAHLATRVGPQLERDLALVADRIRAIGKAAHLILVRLQRYRAFVKRTLSGLVHRESQLAAQRTLLVHDEHTFEIGRELAEDQDFARWMVEPDNLCAGIETNLRLLVADLDGLEGGLSAVPAAVERLLEKAELAEPDILHDPLLGFDDATHPLGGTDTSLSLPRLDEVPVRLDDGDWEALEAHELESDIVFGATSVEALGVEVTEWLAQRSGTGKRKTRLCAVCNNTVMGGATLGRAHVLCVPCRERANTGGHEWLRSVGFDPFRPDVSMRFGTTKDETHRDRSDRSGEPSRPFRGSGAVARADVSTDRASARYETKPITRVIFESVVGWVPSVGPGDDPVTDLSWYEAVEFCNALSRREGRKPAYRISGDAVTLRRGPDVDGWRLPDGAAPASSTREWLWGTAETNGGASPNPPRRLSGGLRLIGNPARPDVFDRAVPDAREPDVSFRIVCTGLPHKSVATPPKPTPQRPQRPSRRSPSPTPARPASPDAARRVVQAISLGMLVSGASVAVLVDQHTSPNTSTQTRSSSPTPMTRPVISPSTPAEPTPEPPAPVATAPESPEPTAEARADLQLEQGYAERAKKNRKGARASFDRAVVVAPDDLTARYEAAREAAYARDSAQAFIHLDVIKKAVAEHGKARQILLQALSEPDFNRLNKRDARWKAIDKAATSP